MGSRSPNTYRQLRQRSVFKRHPLASQAWIVRATVNLAYGYAAIAAFDKSDVHVVDGLLQAGSQFSRFDCSDSALYMGRAKRIVFVNQPNAVCPHDQR